MAHTRNRKMRRWLSDNAEAKLNAFVDHHQAAAQAAADRGDFDTADSHVAAVYDRLLHILQTAKSGTSIPAWLGPAFTWARDILTREPCAECGRKPQGERTVH